MGVLTFSLANGNDDGYRYRSSTTWANVAADATGGGSDTQTLIYATREVSGANYYIANALLRWDTSSLSGKTVASANLLIYVPTVGTADSLKLVGDWYDFGGAPGVNGDWANLTDDAGATAVAGTTISSLTTGAVNTIALANVSSISTSGYTGLRLGVSKRAADAAPTGYNAVEIAAFESVAQEPRLEVTWSGGSAFMPLLGVG